MPKLKTRKAVSKRFKVTSKGKMVCRRGGKSHLMSCKSSKRRRHLRQPLIIAAVMAKRIEHSIAQ